jgi:hypothetical protein
VSSPGSSPPATGRRRRGACGSQAFGAGVMNKTPCRSGQRRHQLPASSMSALNRSGSSQVTALSCTRPGNCSAGGYYADKSFGLFAGQVFVVNEG